MILFINKCFINNKLEESWITDVTCCHLDFSEKPSGKTAAKKKKKKKNYEGTSNSMSTGHGQDMYRLTRKEDTWQSQSIWNKKYCTL